MSEYIVGSKNLNNGFEDDIDENTYNTLSQSKEILFEARSKENIYNIILMNYYEFEKELFEISLNYEIFTSDYQDFNNYISKIEQRILNLLSSITLYLDSFKDDLKNTPKYSLHVKEEFQIIANYVEELRNNDKKIEIMQFLRNHIQHNGLLVENFSLNGVKLSDDLREQTLRFHIDKNKVKARGYKIEDYVGMEDDISLKKYMREYIDFISSVHNQFRQTTNDKVKKARDSFEEILNKYPEHRYLYIAKKENDVKTDEVAIFLNWDNIRVGLIQKNSVPTYFKRHSINTK